MTNKMSGISIQLSQDWLWYNSSVTANNWGHESDGSNGDNQNSGAYVRARGVCVCACVRATGIFNQLTGSYMPFAEYFLSVRW